MPSVAVVIPSQTIAKRILYFLEFFFVVFGVIFSYRSHFAVAVKVLSILLLNSHIRVYVCKYVCLLHIGVFQLYPNYQFRRGLSSQNNFELKCAVYSGFLFSTAVLKIKHYSLNFLGAAIN